MRCKNCYWFFKLSGSRVAGYCEDSETGQLSNTTIFKSCEKYKRLWWKFWVKSNG